MKALMISIQPKWCELIAKGEKTIEVRKTRPKIETPFKCYIYCTYYYGAGDVIFYSNFNNGLIIGEFVCDKIYNIENQGVGFVIDNDKALTNRLATESCLDVDDMNKYLKGKTEGFGWHISELKIYSDPKEISEFKTLPCEKGEKACENCKHIVDNNTPNGHERECYIDDGARITKPPQSWQYCEELEEK